MEQFQITILGCGSATPSPKHFTSSQVVKIRGKLFMVDCGEGTQIQLRRAKVSFAQLNHIFISHLHGDHCFGLLGLISSFGLLGRSAPLFIHAPKELEPILVQEMSFYCRDLEFKVEFCGFETDRVSVIYEDRSLTITSFPLRHRMPCCGFLFREKPTMDHLDRAAADYYGVPIWEFNRIKDGGDFLTSNGTLIPHERLTKPAAPVRSYAYCCDTANNPSMIPIIKGVDVVYHDSTYTQEDEERARKYWHSTAAQAAATALQANAKKLILGHFSARYSDETILLNEALSTFSNTILAHEGLTVSI